MAQYNFEGAIDDINEIQLKYIYSVIQEIGFANSKAVFAPVGKAGDNYAASVKRITIEGENGSLSMIAKIAPSNEMIRQMMNSFIMFKNEHMMYTEVLPKFTQIEIDADIPEEEQLKYAKCYGSCPEQPNEVILLEDLSESDFVMLDRFVSLSDETVRSVLKNFAQFHSLSFAFKHKEPETYEYFASNLIDMWAVMSLAEEVKAYFVGLEENTIAVLDNPAHINLVRHKVCDVLDLAAKMAKSDMSDKYSVILQGDSWTNNIMFRFENDTLAESIMIDYQISRNGSPVCDLLYMIFNCTDQETRKHNYFDWLDYYHSELEKNLYTFDLKANLIYPRDKLDTDLRRYAKLMFGYSIILASMLIRKTEDAAKVLEVMKNENMMEQVDEMAISQLDEESKNLFKKRVIGLIDSYISFGLL